MNFLLIDLAISPCLTVIVNVVLATDIFDKQLKELRNARWEKAFRERGPLEPLQADDVNRKATIVIEHIIQASDVGLWRIRCI